MLRPNEGATCNGHNLGATYGDAAGTNNGCATEEPDVLIVADPDAHLASNIPANTCTSYPQEDKHGNIASTNQISGNYNYSGNVILCAISN